MMRIAYPYQSIRIGSQAPALAVSLKPRCRDSLCWSFLTWKQAIETESEASQDSQSHSQLPRRSLLLLSQSRLDDGAPEVLHHCPALAPPLRLRSPYEVCCPPSRARSLRAWIMCHSCCLPPSYCCFRGRTSGSCSFLGRCCKASKWFAPVTCIVRIAVIVLAPELRPSQSPTAARLQDPSLYI